MRGSKIPGLENPALQMVLDWFAPLERAPDRPGDDPVNRPVNHSAGLAGEAPELLPTERGPAPRHHPHPQANRGLWLDGQHVAYVLVRAKRRSIGFVVDAQGLTVRAPRWALVADIEQALHDKAGWILRKLHEAGLRRDRQQADRIAWADGTQLPYLGRPLTLRLGPGPLAAPVVIIRRGRDRIGLRLQEAGDGASAILWIGLPAEAPAHILRDLVADWLQHQARALFAQRLPLYAAPLGVRWTQLSLTSARTRWGSATSAGHIRLNWRLMHFRLPVIDYVVAHELSHLRVMDHSPRFWQTVATVMPDYAALRAELKQAAVPQWE